MPRRAHVALGSALICFLLRWLRPRTAQVLWALVLSALGKITGAPSLRDAGNVAQARAIGVSLPTNSVSISASDTCAVGPKDVLRGSLLLPSDNEGPFPTVIIRTPYGRKQEFGQTLLAQRGFAVLVQDTRGRFSSDGDFVPVKDEREDGAATVAWVHEQPWCNGRVGVTGVSYLGFTAWAAIGTSGAHIDAAVLTITQASVKSAIMHRNGAFSFELAVLWLYLVMNLMVDMETDPSSFMKKFAAGWWKGTLAQAEMHLPLREVDEIILGRKMQFLQDGLEAYDNPGSAFWDDKDTLNDFTGPMPPLHMVTGLYDIFLNQCIQDFARCGPTAKLTIGPFSHWGAIRHHSLMARTLVATFEEHLQDKPPASPTARVRAAVLGTTGSWAEFETWPPSSSTYLQWLAPKESLSTSQTPNWTASYVYDPADPTPAKGGPSFNFLNTGAKSQADIEARSDVLVFSSPPLQADLFVAGAVLLELRVQIDCESADFVGRLCNVGRDEVSTNICEGLSRVTGCGEHVVHVELGHTCCLFRRGHQVRLHVCSGAHPRWNRNLQTGEPIATGTRIVKARHQVQTGSVLSLPVLPGSALVTSQL